MADLAEVIIDASALIEAFTGTKPDPGLRRRVLTKRGAAPELLDVEVADVLRRMVLQHELSEEDARDTLLDIVATPIARSPHRELIGRVWQLRHGIRAYDAAYVALAE